jgi:4-pyridoxate dehydrogenase
LSASTHSEILSEKDWATLRAGVGLVRETGRQTPLPLFTTGEISLWPDCRSDTAIDAHIRATAITVHHPLGTCKVELRRDRSLLECCLFR